MKSKKQKNKHRHEHNAQTRHDLFLSIKHKQNNSLLNTPSAKKLFNQADDGIIRTVYLHEIYNKVPRHLKEVPVRVMELHDFDCSPTMKKKVKKWLNQDN